MKKLFNVLIILFLCQNISYAQDTITVTVGKQSKVIIIAEDREALKNFKKVDVNQILGDVIKEVEEQEEKTKQEEKYVYRYNSNSGLIEITFEKHPTDTLVVKQKKPRRFRRYLAIDIGLNSYLENGRNPSEENKNYGLSLGRSRFISLGTYGSMKIGKLSSPLSLHFGLEFSWYNFMFENNNYIVEGETAVEFQDYQEDFGETLSKSKLTIPYMNLPLRIELITKDKQGKQAFKLGIGGYVGYRIGSYRKVKDNGRNKERSHNNFYLNSWRYGVETHLGFRDFTLFVKYDLNELFATDKGPKLNAFAFGIRI